MKLFNDRCKLVKSFSQKRPDRVHIPENSSITWTVRYGASWYLLPRTSRSFSFYPTPFSPDFDIIKLSLPVLGPGKLHYIWLLCVPEHFTSVFLVSPITLEAFQWYGLDLKLLSYHVLLQLSVTHQVLRMALSHHPTPSLAPNQLSSLISYFSHPVLQPNRVTCPFPYTAPAFEGFAHSDPILSCPHRPRSYPSHPRKSKRFLFQMFSLMFHLERSFSFFQAVLTLVIMLKTSMG